LSSFLLHRPAHPPPHHSFPTRRSSDLEKDHARRGRQRRAQVPRVRLTAPRARVDDSQSQTVRKASRDGYRAVGGAVVTHEHLERSEEHTSELQSLRHLVCRLLLEKKKK